MSPYPLPNLSADYVLDNREVVRYRRDGHVFLPAVASPEDVAAFLPVISDAAMRFNTETRPIDERDTYGKAFLQITNLWVRDEGVRRFTLAKRFGQIAADLMGVDAVRIYHDQALYKEPGGGPTPWHQDEYYWPLDTDNTITMWMPLAPLPGGVTGMVFASQSNHLGYLGEFQISDESDEVFETLIADRSLHVTEPRSMQPGDATFHSGWTLHSAPGNSTDAMREVMTVIYFADGARLLEPDNPHRANDLQSWFPGLKPGDLAASELNPVVWER